MFSFFQTIADQIHLVAIVPDGPTQGRSFGSKVQAAQEWASERNAQGMNIYWTVNCVRPNFHRKPSKKDIIDVRYAHIDIDPPKDGSPFDREAAISKLSSAPIQPSFTIWSGNGVQAFWRVKDISHEQGETINRGLISYFGGDVGTHIGVEFWFFNDSAGQVIVEPPTVGMLHVDEPLVRPLGV